jgi:broad specificity phosphatase PhoE
MTKLILVKHAPPQAAPEIVSHRWVLSDEGRQRCNWLADELGAQGVTRLYSSLEPKTLETAALVAVRLGLAVEPRPKLHENNRTGLGFVSEDELQRQLREFFEKPDQTVIGGETANSAFERFTEAIGYIAPERHSRPLAIVAHGAVLSLFVTRHNAITPFDLWARLALPSYVVLDAASFSFDGEVHNHPEAGSNRAPGSAAERGPTVAARG